MYPLDDQGPGLLNMQGQRVLALTHQDVQGGELGSQGHLLVEGHYVWAGRHVAGKRGDQGRNQRWLSAGLACGPQLRGGREAGPAPTCGGAEGGTRPLLPRQWPGSGVWL